VRTVACKHRFWGNCGAARPESSIEPDHSKNIEEAKMEDFPIWLKILIYAIVGFTVIYAAVAFIRTVVG